MPNLFEALRPHTSHEGVFLVTFSPIIDAESAVCLIEGILSYRGLGSEIASSDKECMNAIRVLTQGLNQPVAHLSSGDSLGRQERQQIGNELLNSSVATEIIDILVVQEQLSIHVQDSHTLVECIGLFLKLKGQLVEGEQQLGKGHKEEWKAGTAENCRATKFYETG